MEDSNHILCSVPNICHTHDLVYSVASYSSCCFPYHSSCCSERRTSSEQRSSQQSITNKEFIDCWNAVKEKKKIILTKQEDSTEFLEELTVKIKENLKTPPNGSWMKKPNLESLSKSQKRGVSVFFFLTYCVLSLFYVL